MCGYLPRFVAITFLTLLLTACGGGGGGGIGGGDDDAAATPVLTISILDSGGVPTNDVMGNTPVTIRAVLEDGTGSSIGGQVISFSSEVGQLNPVSGTVLTGTDGVAEISLGAGTEAKAGTASASTTIDGVTILSNSVGIQSDGLEVDVSSSTLTVSFSLSTPDNSITVTRDNIGTGTITVTDANGDPVSQAIVQFSTSAGVLEPASGAVTTNSSGIATITLLAGTTAGSGLLSATVSNEVETVEAADQSFITDGTAFASIELSILSQVVARSPNPAPTSAVVGGAVVISNASPETIVATVIDAKGLPVQGVIVTFNNSGQGVLSAATDITNASGQATTNLLPGTVAGFGEITATTTVDGLVLSTPSDGSITFSTDGDGPFDGVGTSNLEIAIALVD